MLHDLLTDPHNRSMVPTYGSSRVKRYAYYETRKDLARLGDQPGIRFQRGQLEQHLISRIEQLLNDEHAHRRLSGIEEAGALRTLFATAHLLALQLREIGKREQTLRNFIAAIAIRGDGILFELTPAALGIEQGCNWRWTIPLPERRPFREARITIEGGAIEDGRSDHLFEQVAEAMTI